MTKQKIHLVPHFHYDVVYCDTFEGYLKISFANLIELFNIMDKYPEYRFLIEQVILLKEFWERFPEHRGRLKRLASEGRIEAAPGMFVMPDMNLINAESLIRQIENGSEWLLDKLGIIPRTCWIADCWGHHAQLPQILKKCGYKYYAFSRAMRLDLTNKSEFFWQGLDGSTILTHWMPAGYNAVVFHGHTYLPGAEENPYLKMEGIDAGEYDLDKLSGLVQKLTRYATGETLLMGNGSDFTRPQLSAPGLVKKWNRRHPDKKLRFSLADEVFQTWEKQSKNIPTISADFNPLFQGTYCTHIDLKQHNRFLENHIEMAEKILACVPGAGITEINHNAGRIEESAELMLYNQFHDIICGSLIDEAYEDSLNKYEKARILIKEAIGSALDEFMDAESVTNNLNLLVFNSMAEKRKDMAFARLSFSQDGIEGIKVTDKDGTEVPVQIVDCDAVLRHDIRHNKGFSFILPVETPSLGYTSYRIDLSAKRNKVYPTSLKAKNKVIENRFYQLKIADSGTIKSLTAKESGQEFVDPDRPYFNDLMFQVDSGDFWEYYGPAGDETRTVHTYSDPYLLERKAKTAYKVKAPGLVFGHQKFQQVEVIETGPVRLTVKITGRIDYWATTWNYVQYIHLYDRIKRIDFQTEFIPAGRQYRVRACFPANIKKGMIRHEIPFGIEERPEGEYPALNWMGYQDEEKGLCLVNRGIPGNNVTDGVMMLSLFRAVDMGPGKSKGETGYAAGKRQVFEYSLIPFIPGENDYCPWNYGCEFNQPVMTRIGKFKEDLASEKSFFSLSPRNLVLSCVKKIKEGILLRFYEAGGKCVEFNLELPACFSRAHETDCLGKNGIRLMYSDNRLQGIIKPYEVKTFILGC